MTDTELAAQYVGMSPAEFRQALKSADTCPLCIETGGPHSPRTCRTTLVIWADRNADAKNSAF